MSTYEYKAYDAIGAEVSGQIESTSEQSALTTLHNQSLNVYEIKLVKDKRDSVFSSRKVSLKDLEFLTSELSLLLESGVRIDRGLDIIKRTKSKPALAELLNDLSKRLKKGSSLSNACREHPEVFDTLYCNLIEIGEASGTLSDVFKDLAEDLTFKRQLRSKIIGSLTYPSVIFFVCILSVVFIFNVIIPKMAGMFAGMEDLPWYTSVMLSASAWMQEYQLLLVLGLVISGFGFTVALKRPSVKRKWHKISLSVPFVGTAVETIERIRFNSGLAMMIRSGVPIDQALTLANGNINNAIINKEIGIARLKIKQGGALSPALSQTRLYPAFYVSLLEVGEESGNLERVFTEIATRSRNDFESWTQKLTTLLEPLMILFMGGFVGSVVVVMLLRWYR